MQKVQYVRKDIRRIKVHFETEKGKTKIETHEVDTAFVVNTYSKEYADFVFQNSNRFRNFHDVPKNKVVSYNEKAITKVKFNRGAQIMKRKRIIEQVFIPEKRKKSYTSL